jgi:NAD(P)-dependent dehydrogenase (short-subunit alcohol dehydrogenase family)
MGWELGIIGRSGERGRALVAKLQQAAPGCRAEYFTADLSSVASIKSVAEEVASRYAVIDALINNAGGAFSSFALSEDGIEKTMANNHLNYFVLTLGLLDNLERSEDSRIVNVSSGRHFKAYLDFDSFTRKKQYSILSAYGQSKLANIYFSYALARRLQNSSASVFVIHPGLVSTPIGDKAQHALHRFAWKLFIKFRSGMTPEQAAETYIYLAADPGARQHRGRYFHAGILQDSAPWTYDESIQERLWKWSEEVTGMRMAH